MRALNVIACKWRIMTVPQLERSYKFNYLVSNSFNSDMDERGPQWDIKCSIDATYSLKSAISCIFSTFFLYIFHFWLNKPPVFFYVFTIISNSLSRKWKICEWKEKSISRGRFLVKVSSARNYFLVRLCPDVFVLTCDESSWREMHFDSVQRIYIYRFACILSVFARVRCDIKFTSCSFPLVMGPQYVANGTAWTMLFSTDTQCERHCRKCGTTPLQECDRAKWNIKCERKLFIKM